MNVIKPRKAPREPEATLIAVKKKPGPATTAAGSGGNNNNNNSSSSGGGNNNNNNNNSSGTSSPKAPNLKKNRDAIRHEFRVHLGAAGEG